MMVRKHSQKDQNADVLYQVVEHVGMPLGHFGPELPSSLFVGTLIRGSRLGEFTKRLTEMGCLVPAPDQDADETIMLGPGSGSVVLPKVDRVQREAEDSKTDPKAEPEVEPVVEPKEAGAPEDDKPPIQEARDVFDPTPENDGADNDDLDVVGDPDDLDLSDVSVARNE